MVIFNLYLPTNNKQNYLKNTTIVFQLISTHDKSMVSGFASVDVFDEIIQQGMEQDRLVPIGIVVGVGQRYNLWRRDAGEQDFPRLVAKVHIELTVRYERRNLREITREKQERLSLW